MRRILRSAWNRWKVVAEKIAHFQSRLIFTLLYFLIVTPFALGLKLLSDPLHVRRRPEGPAWKPFPRQTLTLEDARKQF